MPKEFLTTEEIMIKYKISRATVDRWRKEGMPSTKIGRGVRFEEDKVQEWIEKNK